MIWQWDCMSISSCVSIFFVTGINMCSPHMQASIAHSNSLHVKPFLYCLNHDHNYIFTMIVNVNARKTHLLTMFKCYSTLVGGCKQMYWNSSWCCRLLGSWQIYSKFDSNVFGACLWQRHQFWCALWVACLLCAHCWDSHGWPSRHMLYMCSREATA